MATEAGAAYVSIIPSARGFARSLQKDIAREFAGSNLDKLISDALAGTPVSVPVRPDLDPRGVPDEVPTRTGREPSLPVRLDPLTKALQDDVRRQLRDLTRTAATQIPIGADTGGLRSQVSTAISTVEQTLSAKVPTEPADRAAYERGLREQVAAAARLVKARVDTDINVDVDTDSVKGAGARLGVKLAEGALPAIDDKMDQGIGTALGGLANNQIVSTVGGAIGLAVGVAAVPAIGAAISAGILGVLGGGVIGLAVASLADDPLLQRAFSGLSTTISDTLAKAAAPLLGSEAQPGPLLQGIEILTDLVKDIAPDLQKMFEAVGPYIPQLAAGVGEFVKAFTPGLVDAVQASAPLLGEIARNLGPLGEAAADFLRSVADSGPAAVEFIGIFADVLGFVIRLTGTLIEVLSLIFTDMLDMYRSVRDGATEAIEVLTSLFDDGGKHIGEAVNALVGFVIRLFTGLWDKVTGGARSGLGTVVSTVGGLPGRIRSALGNTAGLLLQAGKNVVQGLIDGIRARIPNLSSVASSVASTIRDYLPFSPAKTGPLSGQGNPFYSGRSIVNLLAGGITSNLGTAQAAADDLASTFALTGGTVATPAAGVTAAGTGSALTPGRLSVEWVGGDTDPVFRAIREHTRVYYGGDVQAALGGA